MLLLQCTNFTYSPAGHLEGTCLVRSQTARPGQTASDSPVRHPPRTRDSSPAGLRRASRPDHRSYTRPPGHVRVVYTRHQLPPPIKDMWKGWCKRRTRRSKGNKGSHAIPEAAARRGKKWCPGQEVLPSLWERPQAQGYAHP
ncbi:hypothetical protein E2C01_066068 [Portunus trituberculatus]|uniref:Uncharacterized protein n=1 Tax=Portunus trituberculatus TaxID=210409 RepID=A0A5B7HQ02_PORTR|nr:hypothetical protein [Portunus trituberculatus]